MLNFANISELLFPTPKICPLCKSKQEKLKICTLCLEKIEKLKTDIHQCSRCGTFGRRSSFCENCQDWPIYLKGNFASVPYQEEYKELLQKFKFNKQGWLAQALVDLLITDLPREQYDLVIPVPLHPKRLRERGFNQSALLAKLLSEALDVIYLENVLERRLDTPHQTGLNRRERHLNLKDAFEVKDSNAILLKDRNVLIIDDVLTTGTTLKECAKTLRSSGAKIIYCATWAAGAV